MPSGMLRLGSLRSPERQIPTSMPGDGGEEHGEHDPEADAVGILRDEVGPNRLSPSAGEERDQREDQDGEHDELDLQREVGPHVGDHHEHQGDGRRQNLRVELRHARQSRIASTKPMM